MEILSSFITPAIVFVFTLVFGLWLGRVGKPYNGLLFNFHKLIALGAVILTGQKVYGILTGMRPEIGIMLLAVAAAAGVLALFVSGALMSIGNGNYTTLKTIHKIAPILTVAALTCSMYLTLRRNL